jgi:hypothetical protein
MEPQGRRGTFAVSSAHAVTPSTTAKKELGLSLVPLAVEKEELSNLQQAHSKCSYRLQLLTSFFVSASFFAS